MKSRTKGVLQLLLVILVVAAIGAWGYFGYTNEKIPGVQDIKLGLDLNGGVSITYEAVKENPTKTEMEDTFAKLQKRAEAFSEESAVSLEGDNRINVDIPGADDAEAVLKKLGDAGNIYFIYSVNAKGTANIKAAGTDKDGKPIYELARTIEEIIADGDVIIDGSDVSGAEGTYRSSNDISGTQYLVELTLNSAGAKKFEEATGWCVGKTGLQNTIAIVYDNEIVSAPEVSTRISGGSAVITGSKTLEEAKELATIIRIGALPLELKAIRSNIVGATLGSEALKTSLIAGAIGFALVCIFMIVIYRFPGLASALSLVIYLGVVILLMLLFDVTLTLPGIAGVILSVGMAVDANVIIFTRIKEELATGKTVRSAVKIGFGKAASAIIDGNVTTLIAAAVLFLRGSGTIRGFAITLGIGILVSMFTAMVVTRWILYTFYNLGLDKPAMYGIAKPAKKIDFVKHGKKYLLISGTLIVACVVMLLVNKGTTGKILNYGLDFVGGSSITVTFDGDLPANAEMEKFASDLIGEPVTVSEIKGSNALVIKSTAVLDDEGVMKELKDAFRKTYGVSEKAIETETISGTVSSEMKADAVWAVAIATVCMLIYIWIRFKNLSYAASAVTALLHDVLVVLLVYAAARITVDNTFIACMLTLVGYSINATIVIFDRIRENRKEMLKKDNLKDIVNDSISQTLTRSINTSLTTLLPVIILIILGVESIRAFAIPLAVGIVCGTYSSVCITGTLWYFLKKKTEKAD